MGRPLADYRYGLISGGRCRSAGSSRYLKRRRAFLHQLHSRQQPGQNLNRARSAEVELSLERDKNASQSFSSDHPTAGDNAIGNAADTRSTDPKFYRDRGMAFYRNGDLDRALADFDAAIRLDPRSTSAYIYRSIVLYRKAEPDRAFAEIAQAIRIEDSLKAAARPHRPPAPPPKH